MGSKFNSKPKTNADKLRKKTVYTMHEAKTNLSKLVEQALNGEEVVLAKGRTAVAKIVPIQSLPKRTPGSLKGLFTWTDDAFDPLTDQELKDLGFE